MSLCLPLHDVMSLNATPHAAAALMHKHFIMHKHFSVAHQQERG